MQHLVCSFSMNNFSRWVEVPFRTQTVQSGTCEMWKSVSRRMSTRLSRGGAADLARRLSCSEHWDLCWAVIWDFRSETTTILELAHKPNCSCIRDFVVSHVFISWETIKRRSPIAGIVPECPDQWRFRSARCDFHDYLLLITDLVTHTISSRAGWLWKPTKVGINR